MNSPGLQAEPTSVLVEPDQSYPTTLPTKPSDAVIVAPVPWNFRRCRYG
jgi:hypothetical protein